NGPTCPHLRTKAKISSRLLRIAPASTAPSSIRELLENHNVEQAPRPDCHGSRFSYLKISITGFPCRIRIRQPLAGSNSLGEPDFERRGPDIIGTVDSNADLRAPARRACVYFLARGLALPL